ncbi:hypothetical protein JM93_01621 [Roseibium hamelinense]|uniref:Uncharacterized protein n=1 Tax=Roseibium hamelinense TaxID=150831 RepID=A0A562T898_9HYPH|nr:hypothetical protein [Roseibium hamelinense]MTI43734.1 hypothetical protein [Roseibium hamelinense]TWI89418.1 hypothetical protein JM93_01621 [Roseibium hamelinense]
MTDEKDKNSKLDSIIDYNTKHAYVYLPKIQSEKTDKAPDGIDLGAIARLGGYSDLEQSAHKVETDQLHYYPQKHIDDAGGKDSENVFKQAAGPDSDSSHGILLACDGRMLVKAGERLYVETGDQSYQVNGNYELDATGTITLSAGGEVTVKSGNAKSLTINAGDKTGDVIIDANNLTENIATDKTTNILGNQVDLTTGFHQSAIHGMSLQWIKGASVQMLLGGSAVVSISLGFQTYTYLVKLYQIGDMIISTSRVKLVGKDVNAVLSVSNYGALSMDNFVGKVRTALTRMDAIELKTGEVAVNASAEQLTARSNEIKAELGDLDARTKVMTVFV